MTEPASSARTTQAALEVVAARAAREVAAVARTVDRGALEAELPGLIAHAYETVGRYRSAAVMLAVRQYLTQRRAAGVTGRFTPTPPTPATVRQVSSVIGWATQPLWTPQPVAIETAEQNLTAGVEKLVLDASRDTVITNVHRDPKAHGWARVTEANPCAFCALLATRGAVYRSQRSASFQSHDHCRCHAEPTFGPWEPSAQVREWQRLYRDSTTGGSAAKTRREWRRAFDNASNGT